MASCTADARGLLGFDGVSPALENLAVDIKVQSSDPEERVNAMLAAWRERCPIYLALVPPNQVELRTSVAAAAG